MFKTTLLTLAILTLSAAVWASDDCKPTSYGDGVDLETSTAVRDLLASPEDYDGETVRVEGTVQDVCRMMGCWMEIVAEDSEASQTLKIKVEDGVITFPVSTLGHHAVAQGTVEVKELDRESWIQHQQHLAEEQGATFDETTVGDGPFQRIQILGTGAEVCGG